VLLYIDKICFNSNSVNLLQRNIISRSRGPLGSAKADFAGFQTIGALFALAIYELEIGRESPGCNDSNPRDKRRERMDRGTIGAETMECHGIPNRKNKYRHLE
jgi:hypothetical protein